MHQSFLCVMYLLVALMGLHRTVNANDQIQLSSLNTEKTLEAVDQGLLDQTHTFDDGDKIYWNLHVWQGKSGCPGRADKSWTDWVYHACENYNFKQLSYDPRVNGIYRLCVYNNKDCEELIFSTSRTEDCVQVKPQWVNGLEHRGDAVTIGEYLSKLGSTRSYYPQSYDMDRGALRVRWGISLTPETYRRVSAPGGLTLGLEQGELNVDLIHLGRIYYDNLLDHYPRTSHYYAAAAQFC